jgi:DNA-binding LacI/PurR family transcriptional regulator
MLEELGLAVPGDIGLVSLSVPAIGDRVTGIEQNAHLIGTQAVDMLAGALQHHRTGLPVDAITTLVSGRWNPGETF